MAYSYLLRPPRASVSASGSQLCGGGEEHAAAGGACGPFWLALLLPRLPAEARLCGFSLLPATVEVTAS